MSIDRLSATSGLIAALRAEISQKSERSERKTPAEVAAPKRASGQKRDVNVLRRELAAILAGVDEADQEAMDAARPRVVRAVLLWEFGSDLREHSQWQPMLDSIAQTLASDDQHRDEFARMIRELRR
ncbi:hypothetical protein [Novilysobacter erysipheiresistens]|uniref:Uncharacterized protein n=1 Tax=Novilysobacter erysipheiresistens TaxID=1749332 RepID=A0ABU7Z0A2_9GAMM